MSAIAVNLGYLRRRPLPLLGASSGSLGTTTLIVDSSSSRTSVVGSYKSVSVYKYGLTTIERKDVGLLGKLTVYVSPLVVSRLNGPS